MKEELFCLYYMYHILLYIPPYHPRARGNRVTYNKLKSWGPIFPLGRASKILADNWFQKNEQNITHNNKAINQP